MKTAYYVKSHTETAEDAQEFDTVHDDPKWIAEDAAEHAWHYHDGWEWLANETLTIIVDGKEVGDFTIDIQSEPVFYATKQ
jgi:predicted DCC family thiol-disulfide oxidoreductase YuxK